MTPAAERQATYRQRLRDAGLVPIEVWCKPEDKERVREFVEKITPKTASQMNEEPHSAAIR